MSAAGVSESMYGNQPIFMRSVRDKVHCQISTLFQVYVIWVLLYLLEVIKVIHFEIVLGCIYRYKLILSKYVYVCFTFAGFNKSTVLRT